MAAATSGFLDGGRLDAGRVLVIAFSGCDLVGAGVWTGGGTVVDPVAFVRRGSACAAQNVSLNEIQARGLGPYRCKCSNSW